MRLNFSASWIFRGWITCVLVSFYAQSASSKSLQCDEKYYLKLSKCCKKCEPGFRVFSDCTESQQTKCVKCSSGEYQPGWTEENRCLLQRFCDTGKGFMQRPENLVAEEPCRCLPGHQCYPINCEFCERIPTCSAGHGLEPDPDSTNGRKICVACKKGSFSTGSNSEQCKAWTNCKAEGRTEMQPGSSQADAVCGPPVSGALSSWVIVSVLSVITVLCLLVLVLFCYKDKLNLLSVNLRSCVQNLKRTRIQQETLAPLYHSGSAGSGPGGPKCSPCEITRLICQAPHSPAEEPLPTCAPEVKVSFPSTEETTQNIDAVEEKTVEEDWSQRSGGPEEVEEEEEEENVNVSEPLLVAASCVCVVPIREPLEVGENEDCSQAVSPGAPGSCSCRGLDGDDGVGEPRRVDKSDENQPLVSVQTSVVQQSSSPPETCTPLSQAQIKADLYLNKGSAGKQEELYGLADQPSSPSSSSSSSSSSCALSLVSPLMAPSSDGGLYLDKPSDAFSPEPGQRISWEEKRDNKLSSEESAYECTAESLHSQLDESTLTSGQVSGNHNTTFISSGQVMNFSGDVIVVYVSQTSSGSDGVGQDAAFGSPVQEEANETALFFQSCLRSQGNSVSHGTLQDETMPVQEVMVERGLGK